MKLEICRLQSESAWTAMNPVVDCGLLKLQTSLPKAAVVTVVVTDDVAVDETEVVADEVTLELADEDAVVVTVVDGEVTSQEANSPLECAVIIAFACSANRSHSSRVPRTETRSVGVPNGLKQPSDWLSPSRKTSDSVNSRTASWKTAAVAAHVDGGAPTNSTCDTGVSWQANPPGVEPGPEQRSTIAVRLLTTGRHLESCVAF